MQQMHQARKNGFMKSIDSYKENNAYGGVESNINFFLLRCQKTEKQKTINFFL